MRRRWRWWSDEGGGSMRVAAMKVAEETMAEEMKVAAKVEEMKVAVGEEIKAWRR